MRGALLALAAGGALIAAMLTAPTAALATPGGALVTHERPAAEASGAGRWTPRQMRRAEPLGLLREPGAGAASPTAAGSGGPPGSVDGRPPATAATAARFRPFVSQAVNDSELYPNSTNGKIFGRLAGFGPYSCSGTVVHSANRSVLFTAGHCVKEPGRGGWAKKLIFVPSYRRGAGPFGQWTWDAIFTRSAWSRRGNINFDYAAVTLRRSGGRRVEDTVGSLGLAFNISKRQTYRPVGYPANKSNSRVMWECISKYGGRDPLYRRPGPPPMGIGCDMLEGASGGGWAIAGDRLASVTSFGIEGRPNRLYGPKLTKGANRMRLAAGRRKAG